MVGSILTNMYLYSNQKQFQYFRGNTHRFQAIVMNIQNEKQMTKTQLTNNPLLFIYCEDNSCNSVFCYACL